MPRARSVVAPLMALAVLLLAGCAATRGGASSVAADPARCPGTVVRVAVSVSQWADAVRQLAGACATVTTVLDSAVADPHDHELTTGNIAAFAGADLVVLNGADYDAWASQAAARLEPRPRTVTAATVAGVPAGADPHLWYDPRIVQQTAGAVTAALCALSPGAAGYFREQAAAWERGLRPYLAELAALHAAAAGRTYAATETVFDRTAAVIGLRDVTPEGYRRAQSNEGEPTPGELVEFEAALRRHGADVLIYNTQTEGALPEQLRATARSAGVPVVDVTESPTRPTASFVSWQLGQLHQLARALGVTS